MTVWRQRWRYGAIVALLAGAVAIGSAACTARQDRPTPRLPDGTATTVAPRQLRNAVSVHVVVRIDEAACVAGAGGVPGPGAAADWCYFLDRGLDLTRAERVGLTQGGTDDFAVSVALTPADRAAFAAWTAQHAGRQIAVSIQGRVVQAPQLLEPLSGETLDISFHTEADAQALLRQLWE